MYSGHFYDLSMLNQKEKIYKYSKYILFFLFFTLHTLLIINLHCCPTLFPVAKNINISPLLNAVKIEMHFPLRLCVVTWLIREALLTLSWNHVCHGEDSHYVDGRSSAWFERAFLIYLNLFKKRKSWVGDGKWHLLMDLSHIWGAFHNQSKDIFLEVRTFFPFPDSIGPSLSRKTSS